MQRDTKRESPGETRPLPVRSRGQILAGVRGVLCSTLVVGLVVGLAACSGGGGGGGGESDPPGQTSGPDLQVDSLDFSPTIASTGETIHVVDVIRNAGDADASGFQVAIYLSSDPFVNGADHLIGARSIGQLAAGQTSTGGGFLTIPPGVGDGAWYVGAIVDAQGALPESDESNNSMVAAQTLEVIVAPLADLVPTAVSFSPAVVESGDPIDITDRVENLGPGDADSFQVGIYLSTDPMISTGDTLIGVRNVPGLASGAISLMSASLTVPAATSAGTWYVGSLADIGGSEFETDEFNNSLVAAGELQVTQPPRPDLRPSQLDFSPSQVDAGQSITVSERVINQGLVAAGPFRVGIYLSEDGEITSDDRLIGFRSLAGLAVGEESAVAAPLVVPSDLGGTFHVGAIADHEDGVLESDEGNNTLVALGTVEVFIPPMPDLLPTAVSFSPSVVESGETVTVIERVENHGVVDALSFRVAAYLSSNPTVSSSDVLLGSRIVQSLSVGGSDESVNYYPLPAGIGAGSWTLGILVDDLEVLPEPNEGNNLLVANGLLDVTTTSDPHPDLLVSNLAFSPNLVLQGDQLTVLSTVRNEGELTAPQFLVSFYLSDDDIIETTDHLVGARTIFNLGIGQGSAQSFPYTLDASLPLGVYYFGAICDSSDIVVETNEDNNVELGTGTVEIYVPPPPAPDLHLTSLSFDPATIPVGQPLQIDAIVRNSGNLDVEAFHVDYYLSDDDEVTAADTFLGSGLSVPSLAINGESPSSVQLTIPVELAPGTWHVGAIVTVDTGTPDSNTDNDDFVATPTLEVTL